MLAEISEDDIQAYVELKAKITVACEEVAKLYSAAYGGDRHHKTFTFQDISDDGQEIILDDYCCGSSDWITLPVGVFWDPLWWKACAQRAQERAVAQEEKAKLEAERKEEADRAEYERLRAQFASS